jgi:tetratricopeptide (TPR) repeat protein
MKRVLVTFVLALTTAALGQGASPSQQPPAQQPAAQQPAATDQQANVPTSQKVIKDTAEFNAYIAATNITDPAAKGQAMEAFIAQYPNSIVKIEALELAREAYQKVNNLQKVEQLARQILQIDPGNVSSLAIVVYMERQGIKDQQTGAKARADAEHGLQELPNLKKPEGMSDADFEKMRNQETAIFAGTAAFGALQQQDYPAARKYYDQALKIDPNDIANNYQMAIALLQSNPMDPLGFWYGAKALSIAQSSNPPNKEAFQAWSPYFLSKYKKYHGNTDDWAQRLVTAATQTAPPADFVASIPLAPTPCDLAAQAVQQNDPSTLSFSDYELVLSCRDKTPANKDAAEKVWAFIQAKEKNGEVKMRMNGVKVIAATADTMDAALTDDNQAANKADLHVVFEKPVLKPPAPGAMTDIIGVIKDYTPDPFMFAMEKGEFPAAKAPAKKGVAKKGVKKKAG